MHKAFYEGLLFLSDYFLSRSHIGRPGVASSGASSDFAPSGASSDDFWWGGYGVIGIEGGPSSRSGSPSDTWGATIKSSSDL